MNPGFRIGEEKEFSPAFLDQAEKLYRAAGWISVGESASFLLPALRGSCVVVAAWENGRLAGMGRALSDGVSDAYIQDLVVSPDRRRQGIGRALLDALTAALRAKGIDWIALVGEPGTGNFYRASGWRAKEDFTFWRPPEQNS